MASKYAGTAGVRWRACDVCSVAALSSATEKGSADLIFDKGTLDCAIVEDDAARLLVCVDWLMAEGGCYVVFSFRKPALLRALSVEDLLRQDVGEEVAQVSFLADVDTRPAGIAQHQTHHGVVLPPPVVTGEGRRVQSSTTGI